MFAALAFAALLAVLPAAAAGATRPDVRVELVTVALKGHPAGRGLVRRLGISDDGRWVVFGSEAANLVRGTPWTACTYVYARDMVRGVTVVASATSEGAPASSCFGDGGAISGDGRFATFHSDSARLSPTGEDALTFLYVKDLRSGKLEATPSPVGSPDGGGGPERLLVSPEAISTDGRFVAVDAGFADPTSLYHTAYVYDRRAGRWQAICPLALTCDVEDMSGDGRYVAYYFLPRDAVYGEERRPYLFDRVSGERRPVPSGPAGLEELLTASLSDDGRVLVVTWADFSAFHTFEAAAAVYRTSDLALLETVRVRGLADVVALDATGRRLALTASRSGTPGFGHGSDAFVYDRMTKELTLMSVSSDGQPGNAPSSAEHVTADGRTVLMSSAASNLVPGDRGQGVDAMVATLTTRARRGCWREWTLSKLCPLR